MIYNCREKIKIDNDCRNVILWKFWIEKCVIRIGVLGWSFVSLEFFVL